MSVFRSHKHIYAQLIDDNLGKTLVAASSLDHELREAIRYGGNRAAAERIGQTLAERAIAAGIHKVAFDRGPYRYHGRVAAVAEGARKGGLEL
jgi:large subunit ribosomal protein L18